MKVKTLAISVALTSILTACSGSPDIPDNLVETFTTDILADESKRFAFALSLPSADDRRAGNMQRGPGEMRGERGQGGRGQGGQGGRGQGGRGGQGEEDPRDRRDREQGMYDHLIEKLEETLAATGYCREGYFILETFVGQMDYLVEGECNESATDADREKFPS